MHDQTANLLGTLILCLCIPAPVILMVVIGILIKKLDARIWKKYFIHKYIEQENYDKYFNK